MKQTIEIEDGVVPKGEAIDRIGWPKKGELYVDFIERYTSRIAEVFTAGYDHSPQSGRPHVILRKVWTAPEFVKANWIKRSGSEIYFKIEGESDWYRMFGIKPKSLNLPADWDGSPMRCRPEVGQ